MMKTMECESENNSSSRENEKLKGDVKKKSEIAQCNKENSELKDKNTELSGELATQTQETGDCKAAKDALKNARQMRSWLTSERRTKIKRKKSSD